MTAEELYDKLLDKAEEFGMVPQNGEKDASNPKGNAIVRKNIKADAFKDGKAFFGFINKDEDTSGRYSDFSYVVFPDDMDNVKACVVALGVGSNGFKNDYEAASLPGLRRMFLRLNGEKAFFKTSFDDIETTSSDLLKEAKTNYCELSTVLTTYKTVLPAARILEFTENKDDETLNILYSWLATYANFRGWGTKTQQEKIEQVLHKSLPGNKREREKKEEERIRKVNEQELEEVERLLAARRYVVLQGAPGTGKTYTANKIAKENHYKPFFIQFHAETTYSDFVYGLEPNTEAKEGDAQFRKRPGILYNSICYAIRHPQEKVLLIIDEINRANLSNVLGPVFYLFEYQAGERMTEVEIGNTAIKKLPDNFFVIATMNTADRSIAVVDFALRRRFAWYTMRPHAILTDPEYKFLSDYFKKFENIFFKYASDVELNLQPGQSYFIVEKGSKDEEKNRMKERLIYELMPLIKEYIEEGYLLKAKDEFGDLFLKETGKLMYE